MNEKIIVSKKVDEAIKTIRANGTSNFYIAKMHQNEIAYTCPGVNEAIKVLRTYFKNVDELYTALLNGYEVEQSKEEIITEYYRMARIYSCEPFDTPEERAQAKGQTEAIKFFAKTYEIELPGIYEK